MERPTRYAFLNALSSTLPECDRTDAMTTLDDDKNFDVCFVYCAQPSCDAGEKFIARHLDALQQKCGSVVHISDGAIAMEPNDLVGGEACRSKIEGFNTGAPSTREGCLTCGDTSPLEGVTLDGRPVPASYALTEETAPEWYRREGNFGPLPPFFACDPRFRSNPPTVHERGGDTTFSIPVEGIGDGYLAYWASQPTTETLPAAKAYGDFSNRGVTRCSEDRCTFRADFPGRYTEDGDTFPPHVHYTTYADQSWQPAASTVNFEGGK